MSTNFAVIRPPVLKLEGDDIDIQNRKQSRAWAELDQLRRSWASGNNPVTKEGDVD